ncbi:hypothetical protein ETD86_28705 [Nonomuraea turkmeniaca]|uniref:Uncharacterized protein n=1 Tax=Nonomuraea turkmeniaca TaxID=103838 RepID=A0A5S4FAQ2_9ACTN|nr:hypothetical protein [Nonomuraea turkmeniaca]TMR14401.1 hypothetical protein ETD86_28705 [Nonomuraea turkmeniaca]
MPERGLARSLVEAYVHLDLVAHGGEPGASRRAAVAEEQDGWVLRLGDAEVLVPYEAEAGARHEQLTFGSGLSELIDPGQWVLIAATYARRALEGGLFLAAGPSDAGAFDTVAADWRVAADAVAEALKFFPDGATELPQEAFWSEMGRSLRELQPDRLTRRKLEDDLAFYRQSLDDLHRLQTQ